MTELHSKLLEIFKWFHNLCETENLTYYANGGTVLGAVRHKGFIPWDDDIDIGMPRGDYEKLREIAARVNKNSEYVVEFPEDTNYSYDFCKVYDTNTTLIEKSRDKIKRGIYLDIFPIDGIGNTYEESVKNFKKIYRYRKYMYAQTIPLSKNRGIIGNARVIAARIILGCFYNRKRVMRDMENNLKKNDYKTSKFVINFYGIYKEREILEREWMDNPVLCDFEGAKIYIPSDSHNYLTRVYGDYMQLPPEEKRYSHHNYVYMDLNKSYLD